MSIDLTRRELLRAGTVVGAGAWISLHVARPLAARAAAASSAPAVLSAHEWATLEAITARIVPTDHEPGAREAHCVNFIDKALAHEDAAARPLYTAGLATVDAVARARFEAPFVELDDARRDELLAALERGTAAEWTLDAIPSPVFFETVRLHTIVGFLADPKYGGNRAHAGWRVAGYPGPRHRLGGYTPAQMDGSAPVAPVWAPSPARAPKRGTP